MNDEDEIGPVQAGIASKIEALIEPVIDAMGYALVRVQYAGGQRPLLQIMAERQDGVPMSVDDCGDISRAASAILDVEDPISEAYHLEVSSPGIDRPLTRKTDFTRFAGFDVRIDADRLIEGRKRFRGRLLGIAENGIVRLRDGETDFQIPFNAIARAKLILTDDLIKASADALKN
jgi:ribosome maturation factor RimP